jgi:DNA polymerase
MTLAQFVPGYDPKSKDWSHHDWSREEARARILRGQTKGLDPSVINALTRACLKAKDGYTFTIVDYAAIEARVNAWGAADMAALELFRNGGDPYATLAGRLFGVPAETCQKGGENEKWRQLGKIGELGLGYGMGKDLFHVTAEKGGTNWEDIAPLDAETCVEIWRGLHRPIVSFWYQLQDAAAQASEGGEARVGPTEWFRRGDAVWCWLQSDRPIVYHGMHLRQEKGERRPGLVYKTIKGLERTWGGKLCENVVQALSRDVMAEGLVKCERAGLRPVLHVHDEIVCEVKKRDARDALELQEYLMCEIPTWAKGLPINVEGFIAARYRK